MTPRAAGQDAAGILASRTETLSWWIVNALIVLVLPVRLGLSDTSLAAFLAYAVACGITLTIAEDGRYVRAVFDRPDVRGYLAARIAIVAALGLCPFLIAATLR